ncbi:CpaF family protein [Desulfofundulus salinus]|uniref:CpaF family protein n=1 Tax=Desulfofundulus salinus TaxID=2419843 RepID=A0A494WRA8_9FIRM|nr:ATPase, T2SS/T4P/T4SS family [Desulfofundulus salinum]RKO65716.1 CpaF family protein [Desulfofundulus salinum]
MEFRDILKQVRYRVVKKYGDLFLQDCEDRTRQEGVIRKEIRDLVGREDLALEKEVISYLIGLGPVERFLEEPDVNEIMINKRNEIWVERAGKKMERVDVEFESDEELLAFVHRIVHRCGRRVNFNKPLVDARLPDGSRVNAVVPPSAPNPVVTIRRFVVNYFSEEDLIAQGYMNREMAGFFRYAVRGKLNIIVCGATGSGKTTFLRLLASYIPENERLIVIEDTRELALDHPHVVSLEACEKASIYELMVNSLRMRPNRIILGEVRGAEAFELLQAMGTGHEGSLTSLHTNFGKMEAIHRLVRAMIRVGGMTAEDLIAQIAETVDITVFIKKFPDGKRRITHVTEVMSEGGRPVFNDIYRYDYAGANHVAVGRLSDATLERMRENLLGEPLPAIAPFGKKPEGGKTCLALHAL